MSPDYFEDEEGNPLNSLKMMQIVAGSENIIVMGNIASVLRIGPTDIARSEKWTQQKSNDVAHFLEVMKCLAKSKWVRSPMSIAYQPQPDGTSKILRFERPDVLVINSVLVFIRQLISDDDKLFKLATDAYLCHASDESKKLWVTYERDIVKRVLSSPAFMFDIDGKSGRDIIQLFFYSFGLIHHPDHQHSREFKTLLDRYGRERVLLAFHGTMQQVHAHAHNVAFVIAQDFAHWLANGQCPQPERVSISDLLGEIESES